MDTTYRIAEVARRTGFTTATLRYYEEVGLLRPAGRTPSGYRIYDDDALDRLAFIARAKQLGCSLDEIVELTHVWDGGRCEPVQSRLRRLVDDKIGDAHARVVELLHLTADLQRSRAALDVHTPEGRCDDECGCTTSPPAVETEVALATTPHDGTPTIACSLHEADMPTRLAEWNALLTAAARRSALADGVRIEFDAQPPIAELARLATAEHACCSFFRFAITVDERGVGLEVRAPEDAQDLTAALFGPAA
jgi:MerR family transcriptional regulator, copper efflux regulator